MTDNNVISISYKDAQIYVEIMDMFIKALIKKDSDNPAIKDWQDLRDRMNIAIHNYHHS